MVNMMDLDGVAVVNPLLHVGDGADGRAGDEVAMAAWGRVAVLLGNPVAPGAVLVLGLLRLLGLLPPLLLVPEDMPLASVVAIALGDVRGGALLVMSLLANLVSGSGMAVLDGLGHHMLAALLLGPGGDAFFANLSVLGDANIPDGLLAHLGDQLGDELSPACGGNDGGNWARGKSNRS